MTDDGLVNPITLYMHELMRNLAKHRMRVRATKLAFDEFKESDEMFLRLEADYKEAKDEASDAEELTRLQALEIFEETGDPKVISGVRVKKFSGFEYDQKSESLFEWVQEKLPALMEPDWKAFNGYLKTAVKLPPGVEATTTDKVTIRTDLSEWEPVNDE